MNTVAWVLQIVLAVLFLLHGLLFTVAYGAAAKRMEARGRPPSSLPPALRQFIGVAELAAAFGLAVPPALHLFSCAGRWCRSDQRRLVPGGLAESSIPDVAGHVIIGDRPRTDSNSWGEPPTQLGRERSRLSRRLHVFPSTLAAAPSGTNHLGHGIAQLAKFSRGSRCLLRLIPSPSVSRPPPRRSDFAGRRGIARLSQPSREPARP